MKNSSNALQYNIKEHKLHEYTPINLIDTEY